MDIGEKQPIRTTEPVVEPVPTKEPAPDPRPVKTPPEKIPA